MKRFFFGLSLVLALTLAGWAQESKTEKSDGKTEEQSDAMIGWKWANFALLAAGLGYLVTKNVPPLLRARSEEIQKGIQDSARLKQESEARLVEVERRMGGIASDIDKLRLELVSEMNTEVARLRNEGERFIQRIHTQAHQEIEFTTKAARQELKAFSAQLAIELAGRRVQERMNHETQHQLVDAFLGDIRQNGSQGARPQ